MQNKIIRGKKNRAGRKLSDKMRSPVVIHDVLFNKMPQGVVYYDRSAKIIAANPAAIAVLGLTENELFGRTTAHPDWKIIQEDGTPLLYENYPVTISLRERVSTRNIILGVFNPQENNFRWLCVSSEPIFRNGEEEPWQVMVIFDDITRRKSAESRLKRNQHLMQIFIEHTPAAIAMLDNEMRYIIASKRYLTDYHLEYEDITGRSHYEIFPEIPDEWKQVHQRCLKGAVEGSKEDKFIRGDGKTEWLHWEILPWYEDTNKIGGIVLFSEVITKRKEAEEKVLHQKQKAEQLAAELARSNKELENFAYVASHDLREPLRMLTNFSKLLARKYEGKLDTQADEYIGYITEGAGRMQELIRDLLSFARITTQPSPFILTDLNKIIDEIKKDLQPLIAESGVDFRSEPLPEIFADPLQIKQLFQNLIANAIKFRKKENPFVEIKGGKIDGNWVFSVIDNGIGIEKEYFDRIFIIFQRLHTRDEYSGTGIGLSICKRIAERHGGRIWVDSRAGEGSNFSFIIPDRNLT